MVGPFHPSLYSWRGVRLCNTWVTRSPLWLSSPVQGYAEAMWNCQQSYAWLCKGCTKAMSGCVKLCTRQWLGLYLGYVRLRKGCNEAVFGCGRYCPGSLEGKGKLRGNGLCVAIQEVSKVSTICYVLLSYWVVHALHILRTVNTAKRGGVMIQFGM